MAFSDSLRNGLRIPIRIISRTALRLSASRVLFWGCVSGFGTYSLNILVQVLWVFGPTNGPRRTLLSFGKFDVRFHSETDSITVTSPNSARWFQRIFRYLQMVAPKSKMFSRFLWRIIIYVWNTVNYCDQDLLFHSTGLINTKCS
jgi:hypothetical protein